MKARFKAKGTIHKYEVALRKLSRECSWVLLRDVTVSSFCEWRRGCGLRAKTSNDYLHVVQRFFRWLKRNRIVLENPLEFVDPADARADEREYRRALTDEQALRLLEVTPFPRRVVYRMMLETGLRPHEVRGLRQIDLTLDSVGVGGAQRSDGGADALRAEQAGGFPAPGGGGRGVGAIASVRVRASLSKNRKAAVLPIGSELAAELRSLRGVEYDPFSLVFRRVVPKPARWRADLVAAGIPFLDGQGRRVDLYALRKTFGTALVVNGESPRVVMDAMRHSDLKLTMKIYTDASRLPVGEALARLPWRARSESPDAADTG